MTSEIDAMKAIDTAMGSLEPDEAKRVLRWAVDKFGQNEVSVGPNSGRHAAPTGATVGAFDRISDLMDAAQPESIVKIGYPSVGFISLHPHRVQTFDAFPSR